jgi:uncharacterized membrane protein SirB2
VYPLLKHLHLLFIALSFIIFVLRGFWMLNGSALLQKKIVKVAPHIINTLMLLTGIAIAVYLKLSPGDHPWLLAKIIGIVIFILLGVALVKADKKTVKLGLWVLALVVFIDIAAIAASKNPWGLLNFF